MKIRNCFVSNSSSSSFCIYGASLDPKDLHYIKTFINPDELDKKDKDRFNNYLKDENNEEGSGDVWILLEVFCNYVKSPKLEFTYDTEGETVYIGRHPYSIGDDETGLQFKRSLDFLYKIIPGTYSIDYYEGEIVC
jgi:hypothetical protein